MARCKDCGETFDDDPTDRIECPKCGSKRRVNEASGDVELPLARVRMKYSVYDTPRKSRKRAGIEVQMGDEECKATGEYVDKFRKIDRRIKDDKGYVEVIRNPHTGAIIHQCIERLSDHQGHGSAKKTRNPGDKSSSTAI